MIAKVGTPEAEELKRHKRAIFDLTQALKMARERATFTIEWSEQQREQIDDAIKAGESMSWRA
ncbi:hypothetical protein V1279_003019 [Bradyrhizobium sp. AZCC 1610]|uniref:hypothetical protein n=1 Tax=Bradyrhizobium sp. AZCC 1610 TaxID=3117020 RepID=UPI002FF2A93E